MKILSLINENTLTHTSLKHFLMCMVINLASIKKIKKFLKHLKWVLELKIESFYRRYNHRKKGIVYKIAAYAILLDFIFVILFPILCQNLIFSFITSPTAWAAPLARLIFKNTHEQADLDNLVTKAVQLQ